MQDPWGRFGGVYPRACGGTVGKGSGLDVAKGLSPRLRGNLLPRSSGLVVLRSIPALAGEPRCASSAFSLCRVYPRACGGTYLRELVRSRLRGLSPRLRGNHYVASPEKRFFRSIPALAGEPFCSRGSIAGLMVYPRACGGTCCSGCFLPLPRGLSPRLRGNREWRAATTYMPRSIPALAGEPVPGIRNKWPSRVYPRACGGTRDTGSSAQTAAGLSPRLRGNHPNSIVSGNVQRSIPALAGEPHPANRPSKAAKVYPRACGGTVPIFKHQSDNHGLSPRLRGNRCKWWRHDWRRRIPALAGEPPGP